VSETHWANGLRRATARVSRAIPHVPGKMRLMSMTDRTLRRLTPCPDPLPISVSGVRFDVTTSDINDFRVMYAPSVEEGITAWMARAVGRRRAIIWDVGANVGGITLTVAARCPRAHVVAIEASPRMVARLERNVASNPRVSSRITVLPIALTEVSAEVCFYESAESANSGVGRLARAGNTEAEPCRVSGWSGDDLILQRLAPAPDVIKLDIEGFELPALRGLERHLTADAPRAVLFEHESYRIATPNNPGSPILWLRALGYRVSVVESGGRLEAVTGDPPAAHCDLLDEGRHTMNILGINAYHGDVSAVLLRDGELVAAVEEERFRRIKHVAGFPTQAIQACLQIGGIDGRAIDHVAVSRNPKAHLWRKALFAVRNRPGGGLLTDRAANYRRVGAIPQAAAEALGIAGASRQPRIHWVEHHPAHLASTFFVSPFEESAVCAVDGFGDFVSTSWAVGRDKSLEVIQRTFFPHSLGVLYLAITQYLGFGNFGDEFKVMGLAPYGKPEFVNEIRRLVHLKPGGRFELNLDYFRHWSEGAGMTWDDGEPKLERVFSDRLEQLLGPARKKSEPVTERHEALAASLQVVFEEAEFHVLNGLHEATGQSRLCLAGGCAMNSVANGKIRERTPFKEVYIQPASGDNGTALGAAFYVAHHVLGAPRRFVMRHGYWGPSFTDAQAEAAVSARADELRAMGCRTRLFQSREELCDWTAHRIADGLVIGWFQGRMEWGARALGNRSILADPRRADMREIINTKIKFREKFRPFAPSVLEEQGRQYFDGSVADPFMLQVYPVSAEKQSVIPAVTHVDGSGRMQTVSREANPVYWSLIRAFERITGVPVLLNTSFNENEPIVHQPAEALDCFLRTRMDVLALGNYVVTKAHVDVNREKTDAVA